MDDLVFKNIPDEGFGSQGGFSDRVSNPSTARVGSVATPPQPGSSAPETAEGAMGGAPVSDEYSRLSNPTPSRRGWNGQPRPQEPPQQQPYSQPQQPYSQPQQPYSQPQQPYSQPQQPYSQPQQPYSQPQQPYSQPQQPYSQPQQPYTPPPQVLPPGSNERASNPTPTRRGRGPASPFERELPTVKAEGAVTVPFQANSDSRLSNPSPTRRRGQQDAAPVPTVQQGFPVIEGLDRVSNPTPTRRTRGAAPAQQGQQPYVPPVQQPFVQPVQGYWDADRASNPTPSRRGGGAPVLTTPPPMQQPIQQPVQQPMQQPVQSMYTPPLQGLQSADRASNPTPSRRGGGMSMPATAPPPMMQPAEPAPQPQGYYEPVPAYQQPAAPQPQGYYEPAPAYQQPAAPQPQGYYEPAPAYQQPAAPQPQGYYEPAPAYQQPAAPQPQGYYEPAPAYQQPAEPAPQPVYEAPPEPMPDYGNTGRGSNPTPSRRGELTPPPISFGAAPSAPAAPPVQTPAPPAQKAPSLSFGSVDGHFGSVDPAGTITPMGRPAFEMKLPSPDEDAEKDTRTSSHH